MSRLSSGMSMHIRGTTGKWGFINIDGQIVIAPQFDFAYSFSGGLAPVKLREKWGYIDKSGDLVIDAKFQEAGVFSETGLARVKLDDKYGHIDRMGQFAIQNKFTFAEAFFDGFALVQLNSRYNFVDHFAHFLSQSSFLLAQHFSEGMAHVAQARKSWGYLDRNGILALDYKYHSASWFAEGLAFIEEDSQTGLWGGYIDKSGNRAVNRVSLFCGFRFSEGLAFVQRNSEEKVALLNRDGEFIVPPSFDGHGFFQESVANVKVDGKHGFIDRTGHFIIDPVFEFCEPFHRNRAVVKVNGKYGFITKEGTMVIPARYTNAHGFYHSDIAAVCIGE